MDVAVVINPISGTGGRVGVAAQRVEAARAALRARDVDGGVFVTERPGHAREIARAAIGQGARLVLAWGGDGTMNEVASELAFTDATLGIVPSGSGNGLSRELAIPFDPPAAFEVALTSGSSRVIDAGELDGRLFFNIAGIGLDARVAHRFAAGGLVRRGFWRYLEITARELLLHEAGEHTVAVDGVPVRVRAMLVAVANGRQYGNGAVIAPHARLDDGLLDVVTVAQRPIATAFLQIPQVFRGTVDRVPGVTIRPGTELEITSSSPAVYHVDGEPFVGGAVIRGRVRPGALRVRVPHAPAQSGPGRNES
jgi:YegS/Rv2252/BmrU family lipid kinase